MFTAPWKFAREKGWHRDLDSLEWFFEYGDHPGTDRWVAYCLESGFHTRPVMGCDSCGVKGGETRVVPGNDYNYHECRICCESDGDVWDDYLKGMSDET